MRQLSIKQQRFIDNYISNGGNGTQAAKDAGYKANCDNSYHGIATDNLQKLTIKAAIEAKTAEITAKMQEKCELRILSKLERRAKYTEFVLAPTVATADKLHALDSLSKTYGDFVDVSQDLTEEAKAEIDAERRAEAIKIASIRLKTG